MNPDPPEWLSDLARRYWAKLVPLAIQMGVLRQAGVEAFAMYCDSLAVVEECDRWLQQKGLFYPIFDGETAKRIAKNGGKIPPGAQPVQVVPWPQVKIKQEAKRAALRFAQEFGMTPASATRVNTQALGGGKPITAQTPGRPAGVRKYLDQARSLRVIQGGKAG